VIFEYGDRIEAIIVYGAVARQQAREHSDIDVMIVSAHKQAIREGVGDIRFNVDLDHGTVTTLLFISPEEFSDQLTQGSLFLREVLNDGVATYGQAFFNRHRQAPATGRSVS